ncbi:MAG: three-Cys-motif partner protein TcmP [Verrucomicrobiota bacterium]
MNPDDYQGREQTLVKHIILRRYLLRLAVIIGNAYSSITYVDCFCGPWENKAGDFSDTSFGIAVQELRKARDELQKREISLKLRCFFLEKDKAAFKKLDGFCSQIRPEIDAKAKNDILENSVADILHFQKTGRGNFTFVLIDPKGWTGFEMDIIRPLLQISPGEVLITYMTSFTRRFIESPNPNLSPGFDRLYGSPEFRQRLKMASQENRDDTMVQEYANKIKDEGNFKFVCYTPIFQPEVDDIHFHLVYGTRNERGLEVFKKEERKAVQTMEEARAKAQQMKRESGGALELFSSAVMHDSTFYDGLRNKYLEQVKEFCSAELSAKKKILYDVLWKKALTTPLVWVEDLNGWLSEMKIQNKLKLLNMGPREKVPKRGSNVIVEWLS